MLRSELFYVGSEVQLLNEYVQLSPQCVELFTLWEQQEGGDGNRIVTLVLETLACVLEGHFDEGRAALWKAF